MTTILTQGGTDQESITQFRADMKNPRKVVIKKYDREAENRKGIQLLKQRLPNLVFFKEGIIPTAIL